MLVAVTVIAAILTSSEQSATGAPKRSQGATPKLDDSYIPVLESADDAGADTAQVDASSEDSARRAPASTSASAAKEPELAPPRPRSTSTASPQATRVVKSTSAAATSDEQPQSDASTAVAPRRRQPNIKPSDPVDVPRAKPVPAHNLAPGAPTQAFRPAPPAPPGGLKSLEPDQETESDDSGAGSGAGAPLPPAEDEGPSLSDSLDDSTDQPPKKLAPIPSRPATPQLSPQMTKLRNQVRSVLGYYHNKHLNIRDHDPWEVMHSIVAYGAASQLDQNDKGGDPVNSICWMCWNGDCKGIRILDIEDGRVAARRGPSVQGHPGQFLAILAQSRVATSCPMKVNGQHFVLADLIESEKLGCRPKTELTFKLISLAYYLQVDDTWQSSDGEDWSIDRLIQEELAQPIVGAACGGTHRLMGLAYGVRKRELSGLPVTGEFARARKFLDDYHRYAFKLQNADGSFSTEWFKGPGARPDLARRIQTSGHILEWLSYSLPVSQLDQPRVVKAVSYLSGVLNSGKSKDWSVGPLGHALHALAIYDDRYFRRFDAPAAEFETADREEVLPISNEEEVDKDDSDEATSENSEGEIQPVAATAIEPGKKPVDNVKAHGSQSAAPAPAKSANRSQKVYPSTKVAPSRPGPR